mgnify:CR=1 FL=1
MIKKGLNVALMGVLGLAIVGCDGQQKKTSETKESINITKNMEQAVYTKKFTNKDFYKDGKFQGDVALKAYEDMLSFYGIQLSDFMRKNLWITDFELGDFEHVGMAGFFWVNDAEHGYFAHEIYLLPGQIRLNTNPGWSIKDLFIISLPAKKLRTARSCPSARMALSQLNIS